MFNVLCYFRVGDLSLQTISCPGRAQALAVYNMSVGYGEVVWFFEVIVIGTPCRSELLTMHVVFAFSMMLVGSDPSSVVQSTSIFADVEISGSPLSSNVTLTAILPIATPCKWLPKPAHSWRTLLI